MKKRMHLFVVVFLLVCVVCAVCKGKDKKTEKGVNLSIVDVEMSINTSQAIYYSVRDDAGKDITREYEEDETTYWIEDETIVKCENNRLIAIKKGETKCKMKLFHNEGPMKGKKGVTIMVLEAEFVVHVVD